MKKTNKTISIVVSVYNEELVIKEFYTEIKKILSNINWEYEIIFVNDGSTDNSKEILEKLSSKDKKVKLINFSRNFGHEAAMIAGIDYSNGDGIICMDSDLQHPVELIPEILTKFDEEYHIIKMVRNQNKDAGKLKNITSKMFYSILNKISIIKLENNVSDFFAISKECAQILKTEYRERTRFLRGYIQSIGLKSTSINYNAKNRFAGSSKYNIKKLIKFSFNAILNFSDISMNFSFILAFLTFTFGIIMNIISINNSYNFLNILILDSILVLFTILFILIGIIGQYLTTILFEIKKRPIYIVGSTKNIIGGENKNDR